MESKLKCITINVGSLVRKPRQQFLDQFIKQHKPDVVFITEHHLNSNKKVYFKKYTFIAQYRKDNKGGGTAICIRNQLNYQRVYIETEAIENTTIWSN